MDNFDKLDLNDINTRLVEIFNKNKRGNEDFSGKVMGPCIVIINNVNEKYCYIMMMPQLIDDKYTIRGGMNQICSDVHKNGTQNLINIIEFGKKYGYDVFKLTNLSKLNFTCDDVTLELDLTQLKLLTIGNSWYSQFGFNNSITTNNQEFISPLIQLTFEEFGRQLNEPNKSKYFEIIREITIKFNMSCFEISLDIKISDYFKNVEGCLNELFPMRICANINSDDLFIEQCVFIKKLIFFIFSKNEDYDNYEILVLKKMRDYVDLKLYFDTIHVGGTKSRSRKLRKSRKIKSR